MKAISTMLGVTMLASSALAHTVNFDNLKPSAPPPGWTAKTGRGEANGRLRATPKVLAPARNDRRSAGKTPAVSAGLIVSTHENHIVGNTGAGSSRGPDVPLQGGYPPQALPRPSSSTGAMKGQR